MQQEESPFLQFLLELVNPCCAGRWSLRGLGIMGTQHRMVGVRTPAFSSQLTSDWDVTRDTGQPRPPAGSTPHFFQLCCQKFISVSSWSATFLGSYPCVTYVLKISQTLIVSVFHVEILISISIFKSFKSTLKWFDAFLNFQTCAP